MLHITAILLATWTVSPSPQQPRAVASSASRREVLQYACGAASAAALVGSPLPAFAAKDRKVLNEQVVQILRVKESAAQETRLIKTGLFKDKQRSGIKRAVTFMLDNSNLRDRFVTASAYVEQSQQQTAQSYAGTAVEGLVQILEYFPQDLVVNKLSSEQNEFVLKGLFSVRCSQAEDTREDGGHATALVAHTRWRSPLGSDPVHVHSS